jgi:hypothetical protein
MMRGVLMFLLGVAAVCAQSCASNDAIVDQSSLQTATQKPPLTQLTLSGELGLFGNEPSAWLGIRQVQGLNAPLVKLVFTNRADMVQWRNFQNKRVYVQGVLLAPELATPELQVQHLVLQP